MEPLTTTDLTSIEEHEAARPEWRPRIIALRNARRIHLGDDITGCFENRELVRWQVQEMLRVEKIRDEKGIAHELETYNPLIPGPGELSMTLMIEIDDPARRRMLLHAVLGIERHVFLEVGTDRLPAISHLPEDDSPKAPAVHFLTFRLTEAAVAAFRGDAVVKVVVDHEHYRAETTIEGDLRRELAEDL